MSSIDIILLGMLTEQPHNAYEVNKIIEQRRTRTWLRISTAAVYRNLRRLHESGHLEAHTTRDGLKPHKTVFSLSPAGREYFVEQLEESANNPVGLHFDFDAWVAHIHHLPAAHAKDLLNRLADQLREIRGELEVVSMFHRGELPVGAAALVDLRLRMLDATLSWLDEFRVSGDEGADHAGGQLVWSPADRQPAAVSAAEAIP